MRFAKGLAGLVGVLLLVGCLDEQLLDSWSIPCKSGTDQNVDGNMDYYVLGLNESVIILFKESVDPNSFDVNTGISSSPSISFNASFIQTSFANDTLVLSPASSYTAGQVYQVTLLAGAVRPADPDSIRSHGSDSSIKFLAADKATDTVHPYIVELDPANNATGVSTSHILEVVFSEALMAIRFHPSDEYPNLPDDSVYGTSDAITFTSSSQTGLQPNTTYSFVFEAADSGCDIGTMDYTGNHLVSMAGSTDPSSVVWTFTTGNQ